VFFLGTAGSKFGELMVNDSSNISDTRGDFSAGAPAGVSVEGRIRAYPRGSTARVEINFSHKGELPRGMLLHAGEKADHRGQAEAKRRDISYSLKDAWRRSSIRRGIPIWRG
jgi:hypothetical protein